MSAIVQRKPEVSNISAFFKKLHNIKFGDDVETPERFRMKRTALAALIRNVVMLLENGLSLPRALATLCQEPSLRKYAWMLNIIRRRMETGTSFSAALSEFPRTFDQSIINQVKVGERSGDMVATLQRISNQLERSGEVRSALVKRLTYPMMIVLAGVGLIIFMMTAVVPEFEAVFSESGAQLPWITVMVSSSSRFLYSWGWVVAIAVAIFWLLFRQFRRSAKFAEPFDRFLLRIPVVGVWFRDYAVLQFIDTAGVMMDAGFVPVDAIEASVSGIGNRAIRAVVRKLAAAVRSGVRLSDELGRHPDMFPPTVSQLVVVGEQTGKISNATQGVRDHLRRQLESRIDRTMTFVEPLITLSMAIVIGCIVMAIYLPMFGMMDALE